jgi:hypothetical protein
MQIRESLIFYKSFTGHGKRVGLGWYRGKDLNKDWVWNEC